MYALPVSVLACIIDRRKNSSYIKIYEKEAEEKNLNKKEIMEIKKRLKKEGCTFTRMCGCYVDGEHNRVTRLGKTFLNLDEEEFFKYLELAKKVLSGTLGNNLLELEFPLSEEEQGGRQQFLLGLRESKLKNEELDRKSVV